MILRRLSVIAALLASAPAYADDPSETVVENAPAMSRLHGIVRDKDTGEPLAGVTIVATTVGGQGTQTAISDEQGFYAIDVSVGMYMLTAYYLEVTISRPLVEVSAGGRFVKLTIDTRPRETGCVFRFDHASPEMDSQPWFGIAIKQRAVPFSRDRTHRAWIAPAAAADPLTSVTTLEHGTRLHGAPGIPLMFMEEVETSTLRTPITTAAGSGGATTMMLRSGSNETKARARFHLGQDREGTSSGAEVWTGFPLKHNKAWVAGGVVATEGADDVQDVHGMLALHYAKSPDHMLAVAGLLQDHGDDMRAGWTNAHWTSKLYDHKLELQAIATAEQIDQVPADVAARAVMPAAIVTNRVGGRVVVKGRKKLAGYHQPMFTAGGGRGVHGATEHQDGTVAAGDDWQLEPSLTFVAGVRVESRRFGDASTQVTSPRLSLSYDFSKLGHSDLFVAYQRVAHLDDGPPGAWLAADALFHDELATGVSYLPETDKSDFPIMFGVGGRARWAGHDTDYGLEVWMRYEKNKTTVHAGGTMLGNVGTLLVQRDLVERRRHTLIGGATVRVSPDRNEAAAGVRWKYELGQRLAVDLAAEGHEGTDGWGTRMLFGLGF